MVKSQGTLLIDMEKSLKSVAKFYGQDPLELDWAGKSLLDYTYEEIYDSFAI